MSFPFDIVDEIEEDTNVVPREYEIDFESKRLTGKIVEGAEAIKIWIYLVLHSPRYHHVIYSWDYGNELEDLIGFSHTLEYLEIESKNAIEDCLSVNENIIAIENFTASLEGDCLNISFTAVTIYGEVEINV